MTIYGVGSDKCQLVKSKFPDDIYIDVHANDNTRGVRQARIESVLRGGEWPIMIDGNDCVLTYP